MMVSSSKVKITDTMLPRVKDLERSPQWTNLANDIINLERVYYGNRQQTKTSRQLQTRNYHRCSAPQLQRATAVWIKPEDDPNDPEADDTSAAFDVNLPYTTNWCPVECRNRYSPLVNYNETWQKHVDKGIDEPRDKGTFLNSRRNFIDRSTAWKESGVREKSEPYVASRERLHEIFERNRYLRRKFFSNIPVTDTTNEVRVTSYNGGFSKKFDPDQYSVAVSRVGNMGFGSTETLTSQSNQSSNSSIAERKYRGQFSGTPELIQEESYMIDVGQGGYNGNDQSHTTNFDSPVRTPIVSKRNTFQNDTGIASPDFIPEKQYVRFVNNDSLNDWNQRSELCKPEKFETHGVSNVKFSKPLEVVECKKNNVNRNSVRSKYSGSTNELHSSIGNLTLSGKKSFSSTDVYGFYEKNEDHTTGLYERKDRNTMKKYANDHQTVDVKILHNYNCPSEGLITIVPEESISKEPSSLEKTNNGHSQKDEFVKNILKRTERYPQKSSEQKLLNSRGLYKSCGDLTSDLQSPQLVNNCKNSLIDLRKIDYEAPGVQKVVVRYQTEGSLNEKRSINAHRTTTGITLPSVYGPIPYNDMHPPTIMQPPPCFVVESPRRYVEGEVTIHYRSPVRTEAKEPLSEEELARRSAENMRRVYQEERRRKYLQELQDIDSRRHTDNFIPSQKSPIPLNRYDDFVDDICHRSRSQEQTPEPYLVARALYNFVGQTSKELNFRRGDIIFIRRQVDKNWYEGEHNAMIGLFPSNYVEIIPYDGMRTTPKKPYEGQARAKFNFVAQTNLELSLTKGELVALTRRVDENWFEGRSGNRKGIFPVSYVEIIAEPGHKAETPIQSKPVAYPAAHSLLVNGSAGGKMSMGPHHYTPTIPVNMNPQQPHYNSLPRTGGSKLHVTQLNEALHIDTHSEPVPYRALYNYKPQNEDELELREGDTVFVMEKCDDGWYVGSSQRTGYFGTFPGNYVERL